MEKVRQGTNSPSPTVPDSDSDSGSSRDGRNNRSSMDLEARATSSSSSDSDSSSASTDTVEEWDNVDHSDERLTSGLDLVVTVDQEAGACPHAPGQMSCEWYSEEEFAALLRRWLIQGKRNPKRRMKMSPFLHKRGFLSPCGRWDWRRWEMSCCLALRQKSGSKFLYKFEEAVLIFGVKRPGMYGGIERLNLVKQEEFVKECCENAGGRMR
ncbi:hypothetical protein B0H14DRAFT_2639763 [Mycena olivaceomarginata]|nr:hypothetical protein B0H14DRAFT_2639763 [Mycena olivaceomarginata]